MARDDDVDCVWELIQKTGMASSQDPQYWGGPGAAGSNNRPRMGSNAQADL